MAGLDVTEKALIYPEDFERIRRLGNPVSEIVWQWLEFFYRFHRDLGYKGAPMHDPCAVMALIHPEIFWLSGNSTAINGYSIAFGRYVLPVTLTPQFSSTYFW